MSKLYHVTHIKNLESIKKKGLIPSIGKITEMGHGKGGDKLVFLSDDPSGLIRLYGKDSLVLEVDPKKYYVNHAEEGDYGTITDHNGKEWPESKDWPIGVEPGDYFAYETIKPERYLDSKLKEIDLKKENIKRVARIILKKKGVRFS